MGFHNEAIKTLPSDSEVKEVQVIPRNFNEKIIKTQIYIFPIRD